MRETAFWERRYVMTTPSVYVYMLVLCLVCWLTGYLQSLGYPLYGEVTASPLWNGICALLPNKWAIYLTGLALTLGGAFFVHRANYVMVLTREKTWLPFLYYLFFTSVNPDLFPFRPTTAAVFCMVLSLYFLFLAYHDTRASAPVFTSAFMMGLGSLLWVHILWFLPLFWVGMYHFRTLSMKTFLASLLGVLTVYWSLLAWCAWQADYTMFAAPFSNLVAVHPLRLADVGWIDWLSLGVMVALTAVSAVNILTHEQEDSLRSRQFLVFLMLMTGWSLILSFFFRQSAEEFLGIACVPMAILVARFFTVVKEKPALILFHATTALLFAFLVLRLWNFL